MKEICLDANIFIGAFCPDESDPACDQVFKRIFVQNHLICSPAIFNFEVPGVLNKKEKQKLIRPEDTDRLMASYFNLPLLLVWNETLMKRAKDIQREVHTAFYDSCYLALAQLKEIPLITTDQDVLRKGRKVHKAIFTPQDWIQ